MKKWIIALLICLMPVLCYAGELQEKHRGVLAGRVAGGTPVLKDSQNSDNDFGSTLSASDYDRHGTSFTSGSAYTLTSAKLKLYQTTGSASGNITAYIYSDSSGLPGLSLGISTTTIDASTITSSTAGALYSWTFSGVSISNATKYHIVLSTDHLDAVNVIRYRMQYSSATGHTISKYNSGSTTWSSMYADSQNAFETYGY